MLAIIVAAFIDCDLFPRLPAKERMAAVGAEVFRFFVFAEALVSLEQMTADLAQELRFYLAVVEVEIIMRGIADRANNQFRDRRGSLPALYGLKRLPDRLIVT